MAFKDRSEPFATRQGFHPARFSKRARIAVAPSRTLNRVMTSFPTTHWTFVRELRDAGGASREQMMASFLSRYLTPMRAYLRFKLPRLPEAEIDDLIQEFVANRVIQRSVLDHARESRGSLRVFLRVCLNNFANTWLAREARIRALHVSVAEIDAWSDDGDRCCRFDAVWARHVIDQGVTRLRDECRENGKQMMWEVFTARILQPLMESAAEIPYRELSDRLGIDPKQLANLLAASKRKLRGHLLDVIGGYTQDAGEAESEVHDLFRVLANA